MSSLQSLNTQHLAVRSAEDVHDVFRRLGYNVFDPEAFEGDDLEQLELDEADRKTVKRAYIVARQDNHTVYLYEVSDLRQTRLRGLAWHALQRGTALVVVTREDYREIVFIDPRVVGKLNKSSVRVNKLKLLTSDPTRHDADTLNTIHAHRRTGQQIYDAQAEAFNVTTITKKFYDEYRKQYENARAVIKEHNKGIREFQNTDERDKLHAFTQRLLGRLMFLYFLQRKGWLGGQQKFLTQKYIEIARQHSHELHGENETFHYYREVLEPLFFKTLNTKRPDDLTVWSGIRIPYLNGGLFDESRDPNGPIIIPDSLFDPNSSEGLLAFFNRYNFTIEDDTPLEQDVSVDPEMLGKVFENMLEERDRGQSGSFYTPRTIVAYMCQEALAGYIEESAAVARDITRAQFDPDSTVRYTPEQAQAVNAALDTVTVLDPAVGSGSFLIGMMAEIIRLRRVCFAVLHPNEDIPSSMLADWKEAIIRDTLYGVDIKPEAIEIAQLRLWLALVVDQTLEQARPLPNLDYKLMAGNSLIETIDGEPILGDSARAMMGSGVTPARPKLDLFESDKERFKLGELRQKFFRATPEERRTLRADITAQERRIVEVSLREKSDAQQQIINKVGSIAAQTGGKVKASDERKASAAAAKLSRLMTMQEDMQKPDYAPPFFLYRLQFSEVFERKGGFDIVVANPPYVRGELLGDQKPELKAAYPDVYVATADLYVYFFARAYSLLKQNGQIAFITSNKYLRAKYGKDLRQFLAKYINLNVLVDFGDLPIFDAAAYPCISIGIKKLPQSNEIQALAVRNADILESLRNSIDTLGIQVLQSNLDGNSWAISDRNILKLVNRLETQSLPLGEYVADHVFYGIKTGLGEAFVINEQQRQELISLDPRSSEVIRPFIRGRNLEPWKINWGGDYLIVSKIGIDFDKYPAVLNHLSNFKEGLQKRDDYKPGHMKWYHLRPCDYYPVFDKPKIVYQRFQVKPVFTVDKTGYFTNDAVYIFDLEDYFLVGVLNSNMGWYEISRHCTKIQNGYQLIWDYFKKVRIPNAPDALKDKIAALARRCLDAAASAPESLPALEADLNALVYQAYGLDAADIAVIEGALVGKGGEAVSVVDKARLKQQPDVLMLIRRG